MKELESFIKNDDWNEYHLIIRGNILIHILNGHVMSVVIDDDTENRRFDGQLGVQVHVGPPMKIEYRNFRIKKLKATTTSKASTGSRRGFRGARGRRTRPLRTDIEAEPGDLRPKAALLPGDSAKAGGPAW